MFAHYSCEGLSGAAWQPIADSISNCFKTAPSSKEDIDHQLSLLASLKRNAKDNTAYKSALIDLVHEMTKSILDDCLESSSSASPTDSRDVALFKLSSIISVFGDVVFDASGDLLPVSDISILHSEIGLQGI